MCDHARLPDTPARPIEQLLGREQFGRNWANYWSDTISSRVTPPTKVYLNYEPFKAWMADQLNNNTPWDQITRELLTAKGQLADTPAPTFIGYHQGQPARLRPKSPASSRACAISAASAKTPPS